MRTRSTLNKLLIAINVCWLPNVPYSAMFSYESILKSRRKYIYAYYLLFITNVFLVIDVPYLDINRKRPERDICHYDLCIMPFFYMAAWVGWFLDGSYPSRAVFCKPFF